MKKHILIFAFITLFMGNLTTYAQGDDIQFEFDDEVGAVLVVEHGESNDWDYRFTGPGAVVYHDGLFHMFRNGYKNWPLPSQVAYLTSEDGLNWAEYSEEPIFFHEQIPFEGIDLALINNAVVTEDETWVFYFNLVSSGDNGLAGIFRATADDPLGEWVVDETLTLTPGGAWDTDFIGTVDVIIVDGAYQLYYSATDADGTFNIGMATSDDGIIWEKLPDPIITPDLDWENDLGDPRVTITDDGFTMLYSSFGDRGIINGYGIATSTDGITWKKQATPVLTNREVNGNPWFPELVYQNGTYFFYLEWEYPIGTTDIWVSTTPAN